MPCFCSHELADHGEDQSKASPDAWCRLCGCAYFETEQVVVLPVVVSAVVVPTAAPMVVAEQDLGMGDEEDYYQYGYAASWWY